MFTGERSILSGGRFLGRIAAVTPTEVLEIERDKLLNVMATDTELSDIFLRAFILLRERRDDVRLVVLGDGPLRSVFQRSIPLELRDDVLFEGRIDQLRPRYLASTEILCTPCHLASFGMVLLEAMSAGVPVVASQISGFKLLMQQGVQGLLVDG